MSMATPPLGILGIRAAQIQANSARPNAPVIEPRERRRRLPREARAPRAPRTRSAIATSLRSLADTVAPGPRLGHPVA